jgi:hypothetical protein
MTDIWQLIDCSRSLPELDEEQQEEALSDEADVIAEILSALPAPNAPNDCPDVHSNFADYTNFENLVAVRRQHQTIQGSTGTRRFISTTSLEESATIKKTSEEAQLRCKFEKISREFRQGQRGQGMGLDRSMRWMAQPATGDAANAATVAASVNNRVWPFCSSMLN